MEVFITPYVANPQGIKFQQITMLSLAISREKILQGIRKENEALKAENAAHINEINKFRKEEACHHAYQSWKLLLQKTKVSMVSLTGIVLRSKI